MRALVCFHHDGGGHPLAFLLKPGFRHVFVLVDDGTYWIMIDPMRGLPRIEVMAGSDFDLAQFYREDGYTVIETTRRDTLPTAPLASANCVGVVKAVIGLRAPLILTPWQLHRALTRGLPT